MPGFPFLSFFPLLAFPKDIVFPGPPRKSGAGFFAFHVPENINDMINTEEISSFFSELKSDEMKFVLPFLEKAGIDCGFKLPIEAATSIFKTRYVISVDVQNVNYIGLAQLIEKLSVTAFKQVRIRDLNLSDGFCQVFSDGDDRNLIGFVVVPNNPQRLRNESAPH